VHETLISKCGEKRGKWEKGKRGLDRWYTHKQKKKSERRRAVNYSNSWAIKGKEDHETATVW